MVESGSCRSCPRESVASDSAATWLQAHDCSGSAPYMCTTAITRRLVSAGARSVDAQVPRRHDQPPCSQSPAAADALAQTASARVSFQQRASRTSSRARMTNRGTARRDRLRGLAFGRWFPHAVACKKLHVVSVMRRFPPLIESSSIVGVEIGPVDLRWCSLLIRSSFRACRSHKRHQRACIWPGSVPLMAHAA